MENDATAVRFLPLMFLKKKTILFNIKLKGMAQARIHIRSGYNLLSIAQQKATQFREMANQT